MKHGLFNVLCPLERNSDDIVQPSGAAVATHLFATHFADVSLAFRIYTFLQWHKIPFSKNNKQTKPCKCFNQFFFDWNFKLFLFSIYCNLYFK